MKPTLEPDTYFRGKIISHSLYLGPERAGVVMKRNGNWIFGAAVLSERTAEELRSIAKTLDDLKNE